MPILGGTAAFVVAMLLGPLLALVARRRWKLSEARRREVMRLAVLAAQEAAQAEKEAAAILADGRAQFAPLDGGDDHVGTPRSMECAVCFFPTTTRCSRCKAVRYCSGKCQIIHWRQGHKNICRPPEVDNDFYGEVSTKLKEVTIHSNSYDHRPASPKVDKISENEPIILCQRLPSGSSYSSDFSDDTSGSGNTSDSSSDSSSSISRPVSIFDSPMHDHCSPHDDATIEDDSSCDKSLDKLSTMISGGETELNEHGPIELNDITLSETRIYCSDYSEKKPSCFILKDDDCKPSVSLGSEVVDSGRCANDEASIAFGEHENATNGPHVARSSGIVSSTRSILYKDKIDVGSHLTSEILDEGMCFQARLSESSTSFTSPTGSAASVDKARSLHTSVSAKAVQPKTSEPPSSVTAYKETQCGQYNLPLYASKKADSTPRTSAKAHQLAGSDLDIEQSFHNTVQHLRFTKALKQHKTGNNISSEFKMLFPYDYFIKLYTFNKMELRPTGLTNCGNSCYANAVLQCLIFTPPLTAYLLQGLHSKTCPKREWCFICELEKLVLKAKQGNSPLSPTGILNHIHQIGSHLSHGREEDAHEFLRYAIDAMQSVCLKVVGNHMVNRWAEETTLVQLTFGGYLRSKIKCMKCLCKSEQHERMMDLTVEIQGDIGTLEVALKRFTSTETLDGENKYYCNRCKSYERATKKLSVLEAPNILTIALKRFQSGKFGKLNKAIRFPEHLDLAPYMSMQNINPQLYRLYAVVVHLDVMNAAFSGHYVCYVRNSLGKWYKTDDSMVKSVELGNVLSKNAYMLLYARCSPHAPILRTGIMPPEQVAGQKSKTKESVCSDNVKEKPRSKSAFSWSRRSTTDDRSQHYQFGCESTGLSKKFIFPGTDSSSDNSSLFSYSDKASRSTESTRNSTSIDDFSEYIFGDLDRHSSTSSRFSAKSDDVSRSCSSYHERHKRRDEYLEAGGSSRFLFSDRTNESRKLIEQSRYSPTKLMNTLLSRSSTTRERRV